MRVKMIECPKCGKKGTLRVYPAAANRTPKDEAAILHAESVKKAGVFMFREATDHCYFKEWPVPVTEAG